MFFVRTAGERDLDKVRILMRETLHATLNVLHLADEAEDLIAAETAPETLRAALKEKGSEFLVADSGREIAGMGYAMMSRDFAKTAEIRWILVHPAHQRQGIGRDIFAELETCFPDANAMLLEVDPRNNAAVAFYLAHGFVKVGEATHTADDVSGVPLHVYEKPLGG